MSASESIALQLAVQYATDAPELPRWRLRRWIQAALQQLQAEGGPLPLSAGEGAEEDDFPATPLCGLALTIRLVDAQEGQQLNRDFRERDYATNVLTFPYGITPDGVQHADVVLCVPVLQREAAEQGKPLLSHAAHLVIHGTLHALGYDHEDESDALIMEALETRVLARLRIPNPYSDD